jgi:hypothetical protein
MTTVRFIMRWFYNKSAKPKFRPAPAVSMSAKTQAVHAAQPPPEAPKRNLANPIRWHI